jgi:hypothetical protein
MNNFSCQVDRQIKHFHSQMLATGMVFLLTMTSACTQISGSSTPTDTGTSYSLFMLRVKQGEIDRVGLSADRSQALAHTKDGKKFIVNLPTDDKSLIETLTQHVKGGIYVSPGKFKQ